MGRKIAGDRNEDVPTLIGVVPLGELSNCRLQHLIGMEACIFSQHRSRERGDQRRRLRRESMAEHALAMALAAAKRLVFEHENLERGQFNQFTRNRMLAGRVCGIFGFGGIGAATARLMHGIGMKVHAINRHVRTDQRVIGSERRSG